VYDTDGNILQALDDHLLPALLSHALSMVPTSSPLIINELGAGTGRNTLKLLSPSLPPISRINALDLSQGMLTHAQARCEAALKSRTSSKTPELSFYQFDALNPEKYPLVASLSQTADLVLSTLVVEHLPLPVFFSAAKRLLNPGGYLVMTNMHAEMGRRSQAGFVDEATGEKVWGVSYVHEIEDVLEEGQKAGFVLEEEVGERAVSEEDVGEGRLLGPRGKKWIGCMCWFGLVMKLEE
jgi:SAM-dependent methyltransferase